MRLKKMVSEIKIATHGMTYSLEELKLKNSPIAVKRYKNNK